MPLFKSNAGQLASRFYWQETLVDIIQRKVEAQRKHPEWAQANPFWLCCRGKKSNNPCATPCVYSSLPCTNTSCQRHLTPITLRCVLTPSNAISAQWETSWYVTVQLYPAVWLSVGDTAVRLEQSLNAECTYFTVLLNSPTVESCVLFSLLYAEAQIFSGLLSTWCVFKSNIALTQSKHRKCQQLFTESFLQYRKIKYFLFVKQRTRMCRARDDQKMTSAYQHSRETL